MIFVTLVVFLLCFYSMISLLLNIFLLIKTENELFLKPIWVSFCSLVVTGIILSALFSKSYLNFKYDNEENKLSIKFIIKDNCDGK